MSENKYKMHNHVGKLVLNVRSCWKTSIKCTIMSENKYEMYNHVGKQV